MSDVGLADLQTQRRHIERNRVAFAREFKLLEQELRKYFRLYEDVRQLQAFLNCGPLAPIIKLVCKARGVLAVDLMSHRRGGAISDARQMVYYIARRTTKHSLPQLGEMLNKDHTSVSAGIRRIGQRRQRDAKLDAQIREILVALNYDEADPA